MTPGWCPGGQLRGTPRAFNTRDTKIMMGSKKSYSVFAAETMEDQPRDDLKISFALFASFVSKCPWPTPEVRALLQNQ